MISTHVITYAQNATPVNEKFWASLKVYQKERDATLNVMLGRYRNPTSHWSKTARENERWAPEVMPFAVGKWVPVRKAGKLVKGEDGKRAMRFAAGRRKLCAGLEVLGDISIQPTAVRPLSTLEVFTGEGSAIFGHAKRALEVVPTGTRTPRVMWTTTSCTVPNYTDSKAGKKGKAHHVIGALVVEVDNDTGKFWARHITANWRTGEFTDLDRVYGPEGSREAPRALGITLGDYHAGREDEAVLGATERLCNLLRPRHVVLHDLLDFYSRNHHEKTLRARYRTHHLSVRQEVINATAAANRVAGWRGVGEVNIIRSNHDEHLEKWLEECKPAEDPRNAPYYFQLWAAAFDYQLAHGSFPDLFAMEAKRIGIVKKVLFLARNESLRIGKVEHGFHGDKGNGGSRGNNRAYTKFGVRVTKGHDHTPCIMDNVFSAGVTACLDHGYNLLPSTWLNAHVVQYADGKRTIVIIIDGRFGGGDATCES